MDPYEHMLGSPFEADHPERYKPYGDTGHYLICRDCSSRTTVVTIPADNIEGHEAECHPTD